MGEVSKTKAKGKKIGRNRKPNGASTKYRARELRGDTAKCRRVARALFCGIIQKGWALTEKGKAYRV